MNSLIALRQRQPLAGEPARGTHGGVTDDRAQPLAATSPRPRHHIGRPAELYGIVLVAVVLPGFVMISGGTPYLRYLYPAAAVAVAVPLLFRAPGEYIGFALWVFMVTPLLRRVANYTTGWDPVDPIMLAPFLAAALTGFSLPNVLSRLSSAEARSIGLAMATVVFGILVAVFYARPAAALVDGLRWLVPIALCAYILGHRSAQAEIAAAVRRTFLIGTAILSAYAIVQFVWPPPWDSFWLAHVEINSTSPSFGQPRPFDMRVFSTMNSPASFASFLVCGLILALAGPARWRWLALGLGIAALLLTEIRSAWLGLIVGLLVACRFAGVNVRRTCLKLAILACALTPFLIAIPQVRETVVARMATFTELRQDFSAQDRLQQYEHLFRTVGELAVGRGLGINGSERNDLDGGHSAYIDGAAAEILLSLGLVVGTIYLGSIAGLLWRASVGAALNRGSASALFYAAACAGYSQIPLIAVHSGEIGAIDWLVLGLALAAAAPSRSTAAAGFAHASV